MARSKGSASLSASLEVLAGAPLDAREVVQTKADLTAVGSFPYKYVGMEVYVVAEDKKYRFIGTDPTVITDWREVTGGGGGSYIAGDGISIESDVISTDNLQEGDIEEIVSPLPAPPSEGGGSLADDLTTSLTVGGIPSGTEYETGTTLEQILRDLLNPVAYPTLTAPSASLTSTGDKLLEIGSTLDTTFTLTFSRGSISPAYGTSGYRSGLADEYTFDGETKTTNTFNRTITEDKTEYQGSVSYEAGEQPKDSKGNDYSTPLPAGNVSSNTVEYEFVNAWWGNGDDPDEVIKMPLISKKPGEITITFSPVTDDQAEKFDIPASWTLTDIKVYNPISQIWDSIISQFTPTDVTHEDAAGQSVAYKRYTCNLGYGMGERELKIEWSTT